MSNKTHIKAYGVLPYLVEDNDIKILLCKSVMSLDKWGALKGVKLKGETAFDCAKRELFEESSIDIDIAFFEEYFEQINLHKDIGIWIVNASNIENFDDLFNDHRLKSNYLSWENSKVKFFSLDDLPAIKKKQINLIAEIKDFLKSKNLYH
jgi:8-oxo-dGTP pyrophosphatase MutT (NUDIX family)